VASEDNGVRGRAIPVPGLRALNAGGSAGIGSLSCPSPGICAVAGAYVGRVIGGAGLEAFAWAGGLDYPVWLMALVNEFPLLSLTISG
jgi:hypothetical protein